VNSRNARCRNMTTAVLTVLIALTPLARPQNGKSDVRPAQKPANRAAMPTQSHQPATPGATKGMLIQSPQASGGTLLKPLLQGSDVEQMSQVQFRALPDTAIVRYKGQSLTKANFIQQRLKEFQAQAKTVQPKPGLSIDVIKAQFLQKQAAELATENARVQAVMDSLNRQTKQLEGSLAYSGLVKEGRDLQQRYSRASVAEQPRLKQRALEVHNQLLKMEQNAALKNR
jgi:hypothetical protein